MLCIFYKQGWSIENVFVFTEAWRVINGYAVALDWVPHSMFVKRDANEAREDYFTYFLFILKRRLT